MNAKQFILITGGSGFYGKNLVKKLSRKKVKIILLEKNKNFFFKNNRNIKKFYCDVTSKNNLESLVIRLKKYSIRTIVHMAGIVDNPDQKINNSVNFKGTKNVLMLSKKLGIKKFIFISAIAAKYKKFTSYGLSKMKAENTVKKYPYNWIIIRPSLTFGKDGEEFTKLVKTLKTIRIFPIFLKEIYKQPIWINDVIDIISIAIFSNSPKVKNKVYNAVGNRLYLMDEFVKELSKIYNFNLLIVKLPDTIFKIFMKVLDFLQLIKKPAFYDNLLGLTQSVILNNSNVKKDLGFVISDTTKALKKIKL